VCGGYTPAKVECRIGREYGSENGESDQAMVVEANQRYAHLAHDGLLSKAHRARPGRFPGLGQIWRYYMVIPRLDNNKMSIAAVHQSK